MCICEMKKKNDDEKWSNWSTSAAFTIFSAKKWLSSKGAQLLPKITPIDVMGTVPFETLSAAPTTILFQVTPPNFIHSAGVSVPSRLPLSLYQKNLAIATGYTEWSKKAVLRF